jgi:hypothetical protein
MAEQVEAKRLREEGNAFYKAGDLLKGKNSKLCLQWHD